MKSILISAVPFQNDYKKFEDYFKDFNVVLPLVREKLSEKELLSIIDQFDGVICGDDEFNSHVIDKAKKLKVLVKWGTGMDSIDFEYARKKGIVVCNTPNAFTEPVSDTVIGFMLCFARNIPQFDKFMKEGKWKKIQGYSLSEKTLGVIGMGNIGQAVARKAKALGMDVLGYDIKKINTDIKMVDKETLLKESDFVSLNCDLNPTSFHLITMKDLKLMNGGIIINTSRGPVINEKDLVIALKKEIIKGAALDVFEKEPLAEDSELRSLDNVLLSPHSSNSSPDCYYKVHLNSLDKLFTVLKK